MHHLFLLLTLYARGTDRNLVRQLRDGDAVDPESAVPLARMLGAAESSRLAHLVRSDIVRQVAGGRFYLDQARWMELHERSRRVTWIATAVLAIAWLLATLAG